MPEAAGKHRAGRRLLIGAILGGGFLALILAAAWYLNSRQFEDIIRRKVIAYLENATSGRVELGSLHWNLSHLEIEAEDLTIHGREGPKEVPFAHVDRLYARLHVISFAAAQLNLRELSITRPVIHLIVYPDGTTNAPEVKPQPQSAKNPVQQLLDLAVGRADFRRGLLLLNDRKVPFDFNANDVDARMVYDQRAKRYDGQIDVGRVEGTYRDWRNLAAQTSLRFSLWENTAQITSWKTTSLKSSIEINGKLVDFNHPQIQFTYSSNLDLAQVGAIVRDYSVRGGTATINGSADYSDAGYSSTGRIALRGVDYSDQGLDLRGATLNSNFTLDPNRISFSRIASRVLGGEITGDAEVKNYASSNVADNAKPPAGKVSTAAKKPAPTSRAAAVPARNAADSARQQGVAHLRLSGLALGDVARMLSTRSMPYSSLKPAGSVAGTVNLNWIGDISRADADLALTVSPPAKPPADSLPVTATVRGKYAGGPGVMSFSTLTLSTPHTQLNGSGELGTRSLALNIALTTTSLTEFQPLLSAMGNPPLPVQLAGEATFNGAVSGRLQQPQIAGHVQMTDFTYIYTPRSEAALPTVAAPTHGKTSFFHHAAPPQAHTEPTPPPTPRNIHADLLSGDIQYSASGVSVHHGVLQQGNARLNLDGSATLQNGSFTETTPFQLQAALHNADVPSLQRALGLDYPVSGMLNLDFQVAGTEADPRGHGQLSLQSGEAYGRPIKSLTSKLVFANHEAQLDDIHLQAVRGTVRGSAAYNFANKTGHFDIQGESIDLADLPELQQPRFTTAGTANFTAKGSGSLDAPDISAHFQVSNLVLNGEIVGSLAADAVTHAGKLQLTARSQFPRATLALDGNVVLSGDMPADFTLQFKQLDIDPFLRVELRGRITGHSSMAGHAHVSGPLKELRRLNGSVKIDAFNVEVEKIPLASDGPIEFSFADQVITVEHCVLTSEDSQFTLTGSADLKGERPLNLSAKGHVNMKIAQTLDPDLTSYGVTDIDLKVTGTFAKPAMKGRIDIVHAGASLVDLPAGLADVNGSMVFDQDRLEVEHLTGHTGGGLVTFAGYVTFGRTIGFELTADGTEIRFRYAGISVTSDQSLRLAGTLQNSALTGDITVTRFAQIPSADLTFALAHTGQTAEIPNPNSPLNDMHLDVRILSAPELTVQTSLAKLSGDVDLRLRGTPLRPVLLGRINIAEGDIKLNGAKYHLERGDVTFANPVRIDPVLDIEATTSVRDYDITIGLHGTMEKLNTTYRSDPPLSSDDIINLLAFGRTQEETNVAGTVPQTGLAESASSAVLGQALNATVTNRMSKLFGVSSIRINPSVGGPENNPNARLTVEQQVADNVTITYITNLTQSAQQVIQFEYNINPQYTIVGLRDENGVVSFDLLIRQRRK